MAIFRAYDIRGFYPDEINPDLGRKVGFAFGTILKEKLNEKGAETKTIKPNVAVGADARIGSREVREAVIEGLVLSGAHVVDLGHVPTPFVYFATVDRSLDGGLMVTGSHNPKGYLGFKFCGKNAEPIGFEEGINKIKNFCESHSKILFDFHGSKEKLDVSNDFVDMISGKIKLDKKFHVVIDAGNGIAGDAAKRLFEKLGCRVDCIYCEPDGDFPNHLANPLKRETLKDLQKKVVELGADFGFAFDGDGDRIGFVDSEGNVIMGDVVFAFLAEAVLKKEKGVKIVFDFICSQMIEDVIKRNGGKPIVSRVGYQFLRKAVLDEKAMFAGEASAHFYFSENFGYDDALFAGAKFLEALCNHDFDMFVETLPKYITSEDIRIQCSDEKKSAIMADLKDRFKKLNAKLSDIDGVKLFFDKGWGVIRPSNTEPVLVVRWEAKTQDAFDKIGEMLMDNAKEFIDKHEYEPVKEESD